MLTIVSAHSPVYSVPDHSQVSLKVKFAEFDEELPFNATSHDPMPYGVELFNRAMDGEFGQIAPFEAPKSPVVDGLQPTVNGAQIL